METTSLQAEVRESRGKGPARRLRADGKIPGVVYGKGLAPTALTLSPKAVSKALSEPKGRNQVFSVAFGGQEILAMVRDVMVDPVTRDLLHVDFYRVTEDQQVSAVVPFATRGRALGVQRGGVLQVSFRELTIRTTPGKIPTIIEVDVTRLDAGQSITVADLDLGEGVVVALPGKQSLVSVAAERAAKDAED